MFQVSLGMISSGAPRPNSSTPQLLKITFKHKQLTIE